MDNYGNNRGNGNKYSSSRTNQTKTYSRSTGQNVRFSLIFAAFCIILLTVLLIKFQHEDEMHSEKTRNDEYFSKKPKKPDQYHHHSQPQKSEKPRYESRTYDNRQSRQGSEPRIAGNNYNNQDSMKNSYTNMDRNRDTRSSEPGGGNHYEQRNKPPSGPTRISNSAFQRLPPNIDSLPPRLKRKYLLEAGLPENLADKPIMTEQMYSNTLPTGRGRNNRYDQQQQNYHQQNNYQQNNFQNNSKYNNNQNQNQGGYQRDPENSYRHRSLTPPLAKGSRPQLQSYQNKPAPSRYSDWKPNDIQKHDSSQTNSKTTTTITPSTTIEDTNFDWSEDVMNSQSLPPEINSTSSNVQQNKYDDNNRQRRNRRRNRR